MTYLEVAKKDVLLTVANWAADFLDHFWGKLWLGVTLLFSGNRFLLLFLDLEEW